MLSVARLQGGSPRGHPKPPDERLTVRCQVVVTELEHGVLKYLAHDAPISVYIRSILRTHIQSQPIDWDAVRHSMDIPQ